MKRLSTTMTHLALFLALLAGGCDELTGSQRGTGSVDRSQSDEAGRLSLGMFAIEGSRAVIDGDTIRVDGIGDPLRLVGLDAEERFADDRQRKRAEDDFRRYARERRAGRSLPVKFGTPLGERAKAWAREFFDGVTRVRVELDRADRTRGYFDRYLVHVFALDDGGERHFNLEAIRAGMSPYFTKYGRSWRFDDRFRAAQDEARDERRGIWAPGANAYPDYAERLAWWDDRARAIGAFDARAATVGEGGAPHVNLLDDDALTRLRGHVGQEVVLLAETGPSTGEGPPYEVPLSHRRGRDLTIVCENRRDLRRIAPSRHRGRYLAVRGVIELFEGGLSIRADRLHSIEPL